MPSSSYAKGAKVGGFRIEEYLGAGSYAEAYRVTRVTSNQILSDQDWVLKVYKPSPSDGHRPAVDVLTAEREILEKLRHGNIVRCYESGQLPNQDLYLMMDYVPGKKLADILKEYQRAEARGQAQLPVLPAPQIRDITLQLLDALRYLHGYQPQAILHRDINPNNLILRDDGRPIIIDFNVGLKLEGDEAHRTPMTHPYSPPELAQKGWSKQGDIYSLGMVLYRLLTGHIPFENQEDRYDPERLPEPPQKRYYSNLPAPIGDIVLKAIAYDPGKRFPSAEAMRDAIVQDWPADFNEPASLPAPELFLKDLSNAKLSELLKELEALARNGTANDVRAQLEQAQRLAVDNPQFTLARDRALELMRARAMKILAGIEASLQDDQAFDEGLIGVQLDEASELGGPLELERITSLRDSLVEKAKLRRERAIYQDVKARCEANWAREQEMVEANVVTTLILERCFEKSIHLAEQAKSNNPDFSLLDGLAAEARNRYSAARDRYEVLSTGAQTGEWRASLEKLRREPDQTKLIPLIDPDDQSVEVKTVQEAIRIVEKAAEEFAHKRAVEYLATARKHMAEPAPRAARDELEKRHQLFQLDQETANRLAAYYADTVEPALRQWDAAEDSLRRAQALDNALEGWQLVQEAVKTYASIPGVSEAQRALLPRLEKRAEGLASEAQRVMRSDVKEALRLVGEAKAIATIVVDYVRSQGVASLQTSAEALRTTVEAIANKVHEEAQLAQDVRAHVDEINQLLHSDRNAAVVRWTVLRETLFTEDCIGRFPSVRQLRQDIERSQGSLALIARLETTFVQSDAERLAQAVEDCGSALQEANDQDSRSALEKLHERLQGRLEYVTASHLLETTGDVARAMVLLERVASRPAHPDAPAASEKALQLRNNRKRETAIATAVSDARRLLSSRNPDPRRAYKLLHNYKDTPSIHRNAVDEVLDKARAEWERALVADIRKALQGTRPVPDRLRSFADEISTDLPEPRPIEWAQRARAVAAATEARSLASNQEWPQALHKWREALEHDSLNPDYQEGRRNAIKRVAEASLTRAQGQAEAIALLDDVEDELPWDPETKRWRAQYFMRLAEQTRDLRNRISLYDMADQAVRSAREALTRAERSDAVEAARIEDLANRIVSAEALVRAQLAIYEKLDPRRSLADVTKAVKDAEQLLKEQAAVSLHDWWHETRNATVQALKEKDDLLTEHQIWESFDLRSRIRIMDPNHILAQRLHSQLGTLASDAGNWIDQAIKDDVGTLVEAPDDAKALDTQVQHAVQVRDRAETVFRLLEDSPNQTHQGQASSLAYKLSEIGSFLQRLREVQRLCGLVREYLRHARVDGNWIDFDRAMDEIHRLGFGQHRTIRGLRAECEAIKTQRKLLIHLRDELIKAAEQTDGNAFKEALDNLLRLVEEDPNDEYAIRSTVRIVDPFTNARISQWNVIRGWLTDRAAQIDRIINWLVLSGAASVIGLVGGSAPDRPIGIADWTAMESELPALTSRGQYVDATDKIHFALTGGRETGSSEWFDREARYVTLRTAFDRLAQPPELRDKALSRRAAKLLESGDNLRNQIAGWIASANYQLGQIDRQKATWQAAQSELENAFNELAALDAQLWWFWQRKERKAQVTRGQERVRRAIMVCREIAPMHPSLQGVDEHQLLAIR